MSVAAFARIQGDMLSLDGLVGSASDGTLVRGTATGSAGDPEQVGGAVARALLEAGAGALLPPQNE